MCMRQFLGHSTENLLRVHSSSNKDCLFLRAVDGIDALRHSLTDGELAGCVGQERNQKLAIVMLARCGRL